MYYICKMHCCICLHQIVRPSIIKVRIFVQLQIQKPLSYTKYEQFSTISLNHFTFWILDKLTHSAQSCQRFLKISKVEFCIFRVFPILRLIELHSLLRILNELHKHRTRNDDAIVRSKHAPSQHTFVKCLRNSQRFCRIKKFDSKTICNL